MLSQLLLLVMLLNLPILAMASNAIGDSGDDALSTPLMLRGELVQGGLLYGRLQEGQRVYYRGQALPLDAQRRFVVGLDRDAPSTLVLTLAEAQGEHEVKLAIAPREYDIQYIEGVKKKYVAPDPEQVARSRRESAKVVEARSVVRQQNDFFEGFIWPVKGPITGVFGSQRVYNGEPRRPHYGVDIARPTGTVARAPASGVITLAEPDLFFSGGTLIIDHGHGLSSSFLHLSRLLVGVGQAVVQGEPVAEIGATGRVTGAHLDWRMNWTAGGENIRIDPQLLVPPMQQVMQSAANEIDK